MLRITRIKIFPFDVGALGKQTRAFAEVDIDDEITIKGIKIIESKNGGLFIGFPSQKGKDGRYHDLIVPRNSLIASVIRDRIIEAYRNHTQ